VLKLPFDQRRAALDNVPDTWRGMVEAECVRLHKMRKGNAEDMAPIHEVGRLGDVARYRRKGAD